MHNDRPPRAGVVALALFALLASISGTPRAQTLTNPDISAIGDMRANFRDTRSGFAAGTNNVEFVFEELELNFNAYLNPYMRADVFISTPGIQGPVDVEEASMSVLRGLPWSLQIKAGQYLLDFGKINTQHPHQWAWLEVPRMHQSMLGDEGLRVTGVQVSTLQSVGENAMTLSASTFGSDAFTPEDLPAEADTAAAEVMVSGRISWFRQLGDYWMVEAGVSGLYGEFDPAAGRKTRMADADLKVRWRPGAYRAFVWVAEAMYSNRDGDSPGNRVTARGLFSSAEFQFKRRFDAGGFVDFSEDATVEGAEYTDWGLFAGFMPVEETARFSLVYRNSDSPGQVRENHTLSLQFLWAIGPHKPHTY